MSRLSKLLVACGAAAVTAAAAIAVHYYARRLKWQAKVKEFLQDVEASFDTPSELLQGIAEDMAQAMKDGLRGKPGALVKMLPSYVDNLPDGSEQGVFYAMDLGGTNFRVMRVLLKGKEGRVAKTESVAGVITPELMHGKEKDLFDMMAANLVAFIRTEPEDFKPAEGRHRELGFTFSFPCEQTSINSGNLLRWTKGFNIPETVGKDVVKLMEEAILRQGVDMKVTALVNDAVGTLAGARYYDSDVDVSVILGTGTNACYEEREEMSVRLVGPKPSSGHMVINTEWGNFHSDRLPRSSYDKELCDKSPNPAEQHFEKLVSGMYLGEIVRLILVDLQQNVGIFSGKETKIFQRMSLPTPTVSAIHGDSSWFLSKSGDLLKKTLEVSTDYYQRKTVKEIVSMVTRRAARLSAAGMVGVLKKIGKDQGGHRTVIAVDGGLFEKYLEYRTTLEQTLQELLGRAAAADICLELSKDGSGVGAALLAASHSAYL